MLADNEISHSGEACTSHHEHGGHVRNETIKVADLTACALSCPLQSL